MTNPLSFLATCPMGMGTLLVDELTELGATQVRETPAGVFFSGPLAVAYRACLWSRLANRILLKLSDTAVASTDDVYAAARSLRWSDHMTPRDCFAVELRGQTNYIKNTHFGALKIKDGIVDFFRDHSGQRPSVDTKRPDLRIVAQLSKGKLALSIDLSGDSLHRRGYRLDGGKAPLKENLAAAILIRSGWTERVARGESLIDPMCGSGTLLIEAAMIALNIAPGLNRERYGFMGWLGHRLDQWQAILAEAKANARASLPEGVEIRGYDGDLGAIRRAEENARRMQLGSFVRVRVRQLSDIARPTHQQMDRGLLVVNPPWGERISTPSAAANLYSALGHVMHAEFGGWDASVIAADVAHARATGLRSHKNYKMKSGPLHIALFLFSLGDDNKLRVEAPLAPEKEESSLPVLSSGGQMVANRLQKNLKKLATWRQANDVECFRVYDADMPEYAVAIDVYGANIHMAEYAAPKSVKEADANRRFDEVLDAVQVVFNVENRSEIAVKRRSKQRGLQQYERVGTRNERRLVNELGAKLWVNLFDYLDTGLFLDHRPIRARIREEATGKRFLNLFCYTGVASVHAGLGGARYSTSVDLSNTYLDWYRENLAINGLSDQKHRAVKSDVLAWLKKEEGVYDLILLDPPTFSNSKSTSADFDVQRDHEVLVSLTMDRLSDDGVLYFSNNSRRFELAAELTERYCIENITRESLGRDFERAPTIHQCWRFTHKSGIS
ncbi:MAG: bifunctional 23S rRNA (guanine(2069)-N(7))-methyltransferase RlmK/23S rRNA (guanine(2445)-N(2))-methyltransferase RlmL [Pseudomonadota bacterium]|nr:bifunctional 23S rRNA (guanine(2069)-N(7))-methyltransferase RlmK/23S rRNA (guanine(2445)-N(2))-methyltransferase RlmL [Pseudomonadota bacterium]